MIMKLRHWKWHCLQVYIEKFEFMLNIHSLESFIYPRLENLEIHLLQRF